ncbi:glucosaminidase domain-containing protein [Sphingobacterium lumbrici]|uniref:glucosaminidase domain-containing protein n=1 Tax=Sphingobacterium lumbrici TaxID=2559600 RepID=UPI0011289BB9|nr:glucosaminidase domain-containing protein [Sphingobacterium lumbrici]
MQKSLCSWILLLIVLCLSSVTMTFGQKKFSPSSYIDEHKDVAQQLMRETGVPASVILAVAIHESAYGNSKIAKHLNNHFGIKGKNNSSVIRSAYKGYESALSSYRDFVALLQRKKATQPLFESRSSTDYQSWIAGIARSGYSVSGDWKSRVLSMVNRYDLDQYDLKVE